MIDLQAEQDRQERIQELREKAALQTALAEAIRRLALATKGRPRKGLGHKDLQQVLDFPQSAPRLWEHSKP